VVVTEALRPWRPADAERLAAIARSTPDLDRQTGGAVLGTTHDARAFIVETLAAESENARTWAITVDDVPMGTVGLGAIDRRHDTAWAWYWLAADARGRGRATRALGAAVRIAFDDLGLHRLELAHRTNNPESCAVATRNGFRVEGLERDKLRYGDERFDVETHALLATDPH
jgi:RimJ/RimL family protein N-acetyltransferase